METISGMEIFLQLTISSEKYIQLLFTLLTSPETSPFIRSNIIVCIGDIACRFPNTVEPWIHHLYGCLKDKDASVRKKTLMVLSHLVLNDMIKAKTNMSEMAKCIEDPDEGVVFLAKSFFTELSRKSGVDPIYNIIPDTISRLSNKDFSRDSFRNIMKFLLAFVTKVLDLCCGMKTNTID